MKKFILSLFTVVLFTACSDKEYEDLNRDPNNPTQVSSASLFTSGLKSLSNQMVTPDYNSNPFRLYAQYWTQTTYIDEGNFDMVTRNIPANYWNQLYTNVLYDFQDAKKVAAKETSGAELSNRNAMITALEVYTWQNLVDAFGNVPYSEALKGAEIPSPKYDDAKAIYTDLFARLDAAIAGINTGAGTGSFSSADVVYHGNMMNWKKFANSLKLKLAMRVSDVPEMAAVSKQKAEEAIASGVFTSMDDSFYVPYEGATPNTNPLWVSLVQSGRSDFVGANTMIDIMNGLNDPRIGVYYDDNLASYIGGPYGDNNSFASYTHVGELMHVPTFRGSLLSYPEVLFMRAHAAAKSYSAGGTVDALYTQAITASMQEWGVSAANIATYLAQPSVAYATAAGDWRQKIGRQFWIALYDRGFEGWSVWRQFDAPTLNIPVESGLPVPKRFTYPIPEQNLNKTNYDAASLAIGGDKQQTKLFWDKF